MAVHNGGRVECAAVKRVHSANGERDWRTRLANANGEREKRNEKRAYIQKRCALAARKPVVAFEIGSACRPPSAQALQLALIVLARFRLFRLLVL